MNFNIKIISIICLMTVGIVSAQGLGIRAKISVPALYNAMADSTKDSYFSIAPFLGKSFDHVHMAQAFTMNEKAYFTLSEQGAEAESSIVLADMNPLIIGLTTQSGGTGSGGTYKSTVELKPELKHYGALLHFYKRYNNFFGDIRSAVVSTQTQVKIIETGGGEGEFGSIKTFEDAISNKDRKYGKMGLLQKKRGFENIQIMLGFINRSDDAETNTSTNNILTGYLIAEIPTGKGTTAEWVFEPRVGNNHGALGLGFEEYCVHDTSTVVAGVAWRKFFNAKEKRSFDLKNKPWSRYIRVLSLPAAPGTASFGIDSLTLDTTVNPGHQLDAYVRWMKKWNNLRCEFSYNFFYRQKEKLSDVADFANSFGVYDIYSSSTTITASSASINTYKPADDAAGNIAIEKDDLDLKSAAVGTQAVSSIAARFEYCKNSMCLGIGSSVEAAHSKAAFAAWNCWLNAAIFF